VLDELKPWLEHTAALKVWHNYAFDRHVLFNHGVDAQVGHVAVSSSSK
tara:strand:- start:401 stop:544 length:144 start_codon:yes stop_codon:yes gene_type:complete